MAINDNTWASPEKVTTEKLNKMYANEVNSTDDIHPQYTQTELRESAAVIYQLLIGSPYDMLISGAQSTTKVLTDPGNTVGKTHSIKIFPFCTYLKTDFKWQTNNSSGGFRVHRVIYKNGSLVSDDNVSMNATGEQTYSYSYALSGVTTGDIIDVFVYVVHPGGGSAGNHGEFYALNIYQSN